MADPEQPRTPVDPAAAGLTRVVAIDGPSGSGKSTVSRALAKALGWAYLDTGAMYRAVTWDFLAHGFGEVAQLDPASRVELLARLSAMEMRLETGGEIVVNGTDVTAHLRSREVESRVSAVSAMPEVRKRMRALQRDVAARGPLVAEGRDMGSVVFPKARWKLFLDAEPEERAARRLRDFEARGRSVTFDEVLDEIAVRDRLDSTRSDAPLQRIPDSVYFDTTGLALDEVVARIVAMVRQHPEGVPGAFEIGGGPDGGSEREEACRP